MSFAGPPPPDGFVRDDRLPDTSVSAAPAPAPADITAPPAGQSAPPPPPGFALDRPDQQGAPDQVQGDVAGWLPKEPASKLSPEDEAVYGHLLRTADARTINGFLIARGFAPREGIQGFVAGRDKAIAAGHGNRVNYGVTYDFPKVAKQSGGVAALDGAHSVIPGGDAVLAGIDALDKQIQGGSKQSLAQDYEDTRDQLDALSASDAENHPILFHGAQLIAGLAVPTGMEGVAAKVEADALAAGATPTEARSAVLVAMRNQGAKAGGIYGGAHGVLDARSPQEAVVNGPVEAALGAGSAFGLGEAGRYLDPVFQGVSRAAGRVVSAGRGMVSTVTRGGAQDRAADLIRGAASGAPEDVLSSIESAAPAVSGARPTLAEVANDPGIAGFQRGHANTDLPTASAIGERHAENALARTGAVSDALGNGNPQAVQDYAGSQLSSAETATAAQRSMRQAAINDRLRLESMSAVDARRAAETGVNDARASLGTSADRDATGAAARDTFDQAYSAAKQRTRDAYSDSALNAPTPITIPKPVFQKLRDAADEFYGDGGGEIPARLQSVLSDMADPHATIRTLTNVDRRLADFAGEARMQGRGQESAFAERVRGNLADFVQGNAPPAYRAALTNAKAVRAEQGRIFETGDAAATFARDRYGNPTVGNNTIPGKLVRPGAAGGDTIEGLTSAVGPDASEAVVRQEIRRLADEGNVQTAAQARALATRYGEAARRFPSVQSDLQALQQHGATLDAARANEASAARAGPTAEEAASLKERSALHDKILASPLAKVADPNVDPSSFVAQLLRRSDGGRQLRFLYGQIKSVPDAQNGFRRALGDYIVDAGKGPNFTAAGDQVPSINKTRAAISNVLSRAGDTLTTQQKIVLNSVSRELQSANFAAIMSKPAGSETALNRSFADLMALAPTPGPATGAAKHILGKVIKALGNEAEVKRLITQAILDPDFAATLLKRPTASHWADVKSGMSGLAKIEQTVGNQVIQLHSRLTDAFSGGTTSMPTRAAAVPPGDEAGDERRNGQRYAGQ